MSDAEPNNSPAYNIVGQRVDSTSFKGIVIQKARNFILALILDAISNLQRRNDSQKHFFLRGIYPILVGV